MKKTTALKLFLSQMLKYNPKHLLFTILNKIAIISRTVLFIYIPKILIDIINSKDTIYEAKNKILLIGLVTLVIYILETILKNELSISSTKNINIFKELIVTKVMNMKYEHLEDSYYLDLRERALMVFFNFNAVESLVNALGNVFELTGVIVGLSIIIFNLNPFLFLVLVILQGFSIFAINYQNKIYRKVMNDVVPINRKYGALINVTLDDRNAKDIRLYDMADVYGREIYKYNKMILEEFLNLSKATAKSSSIIGVVNYLVSGITILYSGLRVISTAYGKLISLGDFSLYTTSAIRLSESIKNIFDCVADVLTNLHFIIPFEELMLIEDEDLNIELSNNLKLEDEINTIEFKDVSFKYPKSDTYILKNISFKVNKGEKISVVGLNGAGKTTLIKLLCRLFKVTSGEILINGINIENYDLKSYYSKFSTIFQDFKMYKMTILENIITDDKNVIEDDLIEDEKNKVLNLLEEVGIKDKILSLDHSYNSILGKNYDESGVELSGGQLQKLAIVRALYKKADVIIMDEPTSALDPIAEAKIYEDFNNMAKDKTVFYISHRMSSSVFCDKVLVINKGQVEDYDTHENLMKKSNGLYRKLFKTQADNYKVS